MTSKSNHFIFVPIIIVQIQMHKQAENRMHSAANCCRRHKNYLQNENRIKTKTNYDEQNKN